MNRYYGGEPVNRGTYLNLATLEFNQIHQGAPLLPGDRGAKYVKVPGMLAVIAGPFAGLAFVIFLPLVGIVGMVTFLTYKGLKTVQAVAGKVTRTHQMEPKTAPVPHGGTGKAKDKTRDNHD